MVDAEILAESVSQVLWQCEYILPHPSINSGCDNLMEGGVHTNFRAQTRTY